MFSFIVVRLLSPTAENKLKKSNNPRSGRRSAKVHSL